MNNIKWLLNHPPTAITQGVPVGIRCSWCGSFVHLWYFPQGKFTVCQTCLETALEKTLGEKNYPQGACQGLT